MKFSPPTSAKKASLEKQHRRERDGRVKDRIKAVLLKSEGWENRAIAQALRIHQDTVAQHLTDWQKDQKLKPENGGSQSPLNDQQSATLESHIEQNTYTKVIDICAHVQAKFNVHYTVSGMTKWLRHHRFSYKHPKTVPAKADLLKQEEFIESYLALTCDTPANEPILFMDSAHPTMATKIVRGWIRKGVDKPIAQTASRTRVNVMGAIELSTMNVVSTRPEFVNAETTVAFFDELKMAYPAAQKIHIILDQSGYHRSQLVRDLAIEKGIELHFLPPYSPNLNPIERLWKVMNEEVRNNTFFTTAKEFRDSIGTFFKTTLSKMANSLRGWINDDFQMIKPVLSG